MNLYCVELYRPGSVILEEVVKVYVMTDVPVAVMEQSLINEGKWKGYYLKRTLEMRPSVHLQLTGEEVEKWENYLSSIG
jgi:hypothetical protein